MNSNKLEIAAENFYNYYKENYLNFEKAATYCKTLIYSLADTDCEIQSIIYRVKHKDECISKFKRKYLLQLESENKPLEIKEQITDLIGLRIICLHNDEVIKIKHILEQHFLVIEITDKIKLLDNTQNQFGYKSVHLDIKLKKESCNSLEYEQFKIFRFEIQIRTIIQDAWSVLDHKVQYKKNVSTDLLRRINRLAALFEIADDEFYSINTITKQIETNNNITSLNKNSVLNFINLSTILKLYFSKYHFIASKIEHFMNELLFINQNITSAEIEKSIIENLEIVKKYNAEIVLKSVVNQLNPFTIVRHCLYLSDSKKYEHLLFTIQIRSLKKWLNE